MDEEDDEEEGRRVSARLDALLTILTDDDGGTIDS